jgi:hypothetical protein
MTPLGLNRAASFLFTSIPLTKVFRWNNRDDERKTLGRPELILGNAKDGFSGMTA